MNVLQAILERRTIRKFSQEELPVEVIRTLVDAARMAAHGGNVQPLKYAIVTGKEMREKVFETTKWAACIPDGTPKEGERPVAYIIVYADENIKKECMVDAGAAVTNIMLAAHEMGIGSCWIGSLNRSVLKELLQSQDHLKILYAVALGYPAQKSRAVGYDGSFCYYLDEEQTVNVPKLSLDTVLIDIR